jgi:succinate dehydrogenase / fumarate reductase, membrane anchor subunit
MNLRSPLSRARGLGSAKAGVHHWWVQRVSAVALVPLVLWFAFALARHASGDFATARAWIAEPLTTTLLVLFLATAFYHSQLGVQVVIEDYVASEPRKLVALLLSKFLHALFAVASIVAVLKIAFGAP